MFAQFRPTVRCQFFQQRRDGTAIQTVVGHACWDAHLLEELTRRGNGGIDTLVIEPGWEGTLPPDLPYRRVGPFPEGHLVLRDDGPLPREVAPPAPDVELLPAPEPGVYVNKCVVVS